MEESTGISQSRNGFLPAEKRLGQFAKIFFVLQLLLLPTTIIIGDFIVGGIDLLGHTFLKMNKVTVETNHFWQSLIVSLTTSLALCSFKVWRNPRQNLEWTLPIILATGTASLSFLCYFLYYGALSLLMGLLFQFIMFFITSFLWWRARSVQ